MVNTKAIGGIIAGIVIIAVITALVLNQETESKEAQTTSDDSSVSVTDSASLAKNNPEFIVDKDGNKKYVISASDSPTIGD